MTWLFRLLRWRRDLRAVRRGRIPQRVYNRLLWKVTAAGLRRLYR